MSQTLTVNTDIHLNSMLHRNQYVWMVTFPYDVKTIQKCKDCGGRYSKTHRGWWWSQDKLNEKELIALLNGKDQSEEKKDNKEKTTSARASVSDQVNSKIVEMKRWMQQKRYSPSTVNTYISFVRQFFSSRQDLPWNGITKDIISQYNFDYFITGNKSYSSQNQWINAIKVYLRVHQLNQEDLENIERPQKSYNLPDVLTPEEVISIFRNTSNVKHKTLLMLIYSCGLRIGETLALRIEDIHSEEGLIYIRGGKGNKDRRVPLSQKILEQLRSYYQSYRPTDYLFEGQNGGLYSNRSAAQVLKRSVRKAGINKRVTLHTLRHSYATHLTNRGVNIQYLQKILGHKSPKTTMIYTHLSGKDIRAIKSPLDDMEI